MASPAANTTLPNPYTPLAFLPENYALMVTIRSYAVVGSFGALVWDIIVHLPLDYRLATLYRVNFPFIVYCVSRLSAFAYLLGILIASTAPIGDCSKVQKISIIYTVALPSTLLLFVFRICALYHNRKSAVVFFYGLWIAVLACSIVIPFGVSGRQIPSTKYCIEMRSKVASSLVDIPPLVHDTIIFLATSWAFIINSSSSRDLTLKNGLGVLIFGQFLPSFSKSILRDGQLYYLSTLVVNVLVIVVHYLHLPWLSPCTLGFPLFVLINTFATHIYRNIRLKAFTDSTLNFSAINKNAMGTRTRMRAAGIPISSPSNPELNNYDNNNDNNPHALDIVFERSVTKTSTGSTNSARRHSLGSIPGELVGRLDPEKQGDV